ncbi:MAG: glycosyltransferase [Thermodesulfovibrionales bacterium]|nr:glycosyltransferase [Thermodesulfovibrionales bacterium]
MPKISIIIPLYNHERYILNTICSVLNQDFSDFELIIINDGSTDRSEEIVKNIKDERIKYYFQENQGAYRTINRGILLSKGDFVSILNSDDIYHPHRLTECLKVFESNPNISAVFSEVEFIDEDEKSFEILKAPEEDLSNFYFDPTFEGEQKMFLKLLMGNFLASTSNLFCRREAFDKIGFFSNFKYAHDYDFFLRLSFNCKVFYIRSPLLKYRIHKSSTFKANEAETQFEVGLILKKIIIKYLTHISDENKRVETLLHLFKLLNTLNTERIIMTLLLLDLTAPNLSDSAVADLIENPTNSFRLAFIERQKTQLNLWKYSQDAWNSWKETNEKLLKTNKLLLSKEKELNELNDKIDSLKEELNRLTQLNEAIINSYSFKIGRAITWPIRESLRLLKIK